MERPTEGRPPQNPRKHTEKPTAVDAIAALGIRLAAPDATMARNAARHRGRGISLADGFALATAVARDASVATFDKRVRRALPPAGLRLCPALG